MTATDQIPVLISMKTVVSQTSLSHASIRRMVEAGDFPRPIKLTATGPRLAWDQAAVSAWIRNRIANPF